METITPEQLMSTVAVALAVIAAIITIDKLIDIIKKWRAPTTDTTKKLAHDKERLDAHEKSIKSIQECNQVLCAGMLALLDHELHNGNADQMEAARADILRYLQGNIGS